MKSSRRSAVVCTGIGTAGRLLGHQGRTTFAQVFLSKHCAPRRVTITLADARTPTKTGNYGEANRFYPSVGH